MKKQFVMTMLLLMSVGMVSALEVQDLEATKFNKEIKISFDFVRENPEWLSSYEVIIEDKKGKQIYYNRHIIINRIVLPNGQVLYEAPLSTETEHIEITIPKEKGMNNKAKVIVRPYLSDNFEQKSTNINPKYYK